MGVEGGEALNRFLWEFFTINIACNLRFTNPFILMSNTIHKKEENGKWKELVSQIWKV